MIKNKKILNFSLFIMAVLIVMVLLLIFIKHPMWIIYTIFYGFSFIIVGAIIGWIYSLLHALFKE